MRKTTLGFVAAAGLLGHFVYSNVREGLIDRLTGILALTAVGCVVMLAVDVALHAVRATRTKRLNVLLLAGVTAGCLLCLEVALRFGVPRLHTYLEVNGGPYRSPYREDSRSHHAYLPGEQIRQAKPEFVHIRAANQLGLADAEIPAEKARDEYRILALGDSFTEGVGAPDDATWLRVMQREVQSRYPDRRITTINAGISGSDPFAEYQLFKDKLLALRPDLLIVAMNSSDLNEVIVRGGGERFRSDGRIQFRRGPRWEQVYALSYIWRFVAHQALGYNYLLIPESRMAEEMARATAQLSRATDQFRRLCDEQGITLLLVVHPTKFEVFEGSYGSAYAAWVRRLERNPDIRVVDLVKGFRQDGRITPQNAGEFYWPLDLHHNDRGYRVMGTIIAKQVIDMGLVGRER